MVRTRGGAPRQRHRWPRRLPRPVAVGARGSRGPGRPERPAPRAPPRRPSPRHGAPAPSPRRPPRPRRGRHRRLRPARPGPRRVVDARRPIRARARPDRPTRRRRRLPRRPDPLGRGDPAPLTPHPAPGYAVPTPDPGRPTAPGPGRTPSEPPCSSLRRTTLAGFETWPGAALVSSGEGGEEGPRGSPPIPRSQERPGPVTSRTSGVSDTVQTRRPAPPSSPEPAPGPLGPVHPDPGPGMPLHRPGPRPNGPIPEAIPDLRQGSGRVSGSRA